MGFDNSRSSGRSSLGLILVGASQRSEKYGWSSKASTKKPEQKAEIGEREMVTADWTRSVFSLRDVPAPCLSAFAAPARKTLLELGIF